jgi:hypothetical protein
VGNGTYVVRWATVSADDCESASGVFSFSIGAPSLNVALPRTGAGSTFPTAGFVLPAGAAGLVLTVAGGVLRRRAA